MKTASKVLAARDFRWPVALKPYKDGGELYRDVTRQTLLGEGEGEEALAFLTRYFEVGPVGFYSRACGAVADRRFVVFEEL